MPERRPGQPESAHRLGRGWRALVLALSLGLLHAVSFAPWGAWWAQLLVLGGFAALIRTVGRAVSAGSAPPVSAAAVGMAFGFGWFVAGVGWLYISMHTYGLMPAPLALLALVLFALYLALFPAAAVWFTARASSADSGATFAHPGARSDLRFALAFAASFTVVELARGSLFTGFSWLAVGYAQVDGPLAGYAPIAGSYGVGFAACLTAALLACLFTPRGNAAPASRLASVALVATLVITGTGLIFVPWSKPAGEPLSIRLLQGNVPQQLKFDPGVARQTMRRYLELIEAEPADLIVLPETAWTVPWASTPAVLAQRLAQFVRTTGSAVAIGLPRTTTSAAGETTLFNSVLLLDPAVFGTGATAPPPRYDKHHLVPFGEFVPWGFRWFVDLMTIPLGDFGRGGLDQQPMAVGSQRIAFNICYEDAFGEELLPSLHGPDGATILANVSNIAWFGDSHALPQHLQIARMRTLETARPMIRATNTGVTAAIDYDARVLQALPAYQIGSLTVRVQGRSGLTPYARTGNWLILALSLITLLAVRAGRRKPAKMVG